MDARGLYQWVPAADDLAILRNLSPQEPAYVVEHDEQVIATCVLRDTLPAHWTPKADPGVNISTLTVARDSRGTASAQD